MQARFMKQVRKFTKETRSKKLMWHESNVNFHYPRNKLRFVTDEAVTENDLIRQILGVG